MNVAYATFKMVNSRRAIVSIDYKFSDGRANYGGTHTVDVDKPGTLYDACYQRADFQANAQNCRLETFKQDTAKPYRVLFTNFQYFASINFDTEDLAIEFAKSRGYEATIYDEKEPISSWSPIGGRRSLQ